MPLNKKGKKILREMKKQYGPKKGKRVFYASEKKGTITGVASKTDPFVKKILRKLKKS